MGNLKERPADGPVNDSGRSIVRVGADIGKMTDPSAIVVTEQVMRQRIAHFLTRSIERVPLGTSYPLVADRIVAVMQNLRARDAERRAAMPTTARRRDRWSTPADRRVPVAAGFTLELVIDGTGVGLPVVDLVRERGERPTVAIFTGGDRLTVHPDDALTIGKGWLVSRLQTLLQSERLHLPDSDAGRELAGELRSYEVDVNARGHASYAARTGHDDLVVALGLSVGDGRPPPLPPVIASARAPGRW